MVGRQRSCNTLFSVDDTHALQGNGEVAGTGIEMDVTMTLHFGLLEEPEVPGPQSRSPSWSQQPVPGSLNRVTARPARGGPRGTA